MAQLEDRVYFIFAASARLIKIGIAFDTGRRLRDLQQQTGDTLELLAEIPGGRAREKELHRQFAADRVRGEWFRPTPALLDLIAQHTEVALPHYERISHTVPLLGAGVTFLLGHHYTGKTLLSLQIARDLAYGEETFFGMDSPAGTVIVVNTSDSKEEIRDRLFEMPGKKPPDNLLFTVEFPIPTENRATQLLGLLDEEPETRVVVLDDWRSLTGDNAGHTGTLRWLQHVGERRAVSFLVLHAPEFRDYDCGAASMLAFLGTSPASMVLRQQYGSSRFDLIVTRQDLRGWGYLLERDRNTGYFRQVEVDPRPMLLEERWWELQP